MRGRLLNVFLAELAQLDTAATAAGPPGYDPIFREPKVSYDDAGTRSTGRREKALVRLPCQVETGTFEALRMTPTGDAPRSQLTLVFHFRDLEQAGLVDADNRPTIRVNDRLNAIYDKAGAVVMQRFANPPGLFATEVTPSGFGFGGRVNLLVVRFGDRAQGRQEG